MRWSKFKDKDALFLLPTPQVLQKVITGLEELYEHDIEDRDTLGDLYEYMLSKLNTASQNGQFRTPKHIRDMMVRLVEPTPDDLICDPACGTAGFLVSADEYIREKYESTMTPEQWERFTGEMFTGFDTDRTMLRFTKTNAGGTEKVWFYDMKSDGYSLDDKRTDLGHEGDIPDIIARFHNLEGEAERKRTEQSFLVDKEEIKQNCYDLSINRYKEIEYEKVEYDKPEVIMARLDQLALDISAKMEELRGLLRNG